MINTITNLNKSTLEKYSKINIEEILYNLNMSVRKIKKSYISCTGYFASYKNKTQVAFESVMERDFYMILEFDDSVYKYEEQPLQINYEYFNGRNRKYTPDTLVTYKDGTKKVFEVKYQSEIDNSPELQKKLELLKSELKTLHNYDFEIFTDTMIDKVYLDNLKFLYKFVFIPSNDSKTKLIKTIIDTHHSIKIKEILTEITPDKVIQLEYIPYLWNYLFHNKSHINLYEKLTMNTTVSHQGEGYGQN